MPDPLFAALYIPNFPVAAVLRAEPELAARPLALIHGKPPLEKIFAVNSLADDLGIAPGMTRAQAEICAGLVLRPRSPLRESAAHAALLDAAQCFSPLVEDAAPDTVLLDLTGTESLFGPPPQLAEKIAQRLRQFSLDARVAIASNLDTALLAARGFPGITVIPAGKEGECLGPLPVDVLFAPSYDPAQAARENSLLDTLDRWGVRTLRSLAALPEISLTERLGQQGLVLRRLAAGRPQRALAPTQPPLQFEEAIELEFPIVLLEPLSFLLNRLLEQLCERMAGRACSTQQLRLTLELDPQMRFAQEEQAEHTWRQPPSAVEKEQHDKLFHRTLRLPLPMLDAKLFLKLLQLDLNAHPPGAPIVKIFLAADPVPPRHAQGSLFQLPAPEPEKLELTLARIRGLVGNEQAGSPRLLDSHRDGAFQMQPFEIAAAAKPSSVEVNTPPDRAADSFPVTALRRFRPPAPAIVAVEHGPVKVRCSAIHSGASDCPVLWKAGPWLCSGDWWEHDAWSRDEWDIAVQTPAGVSLYRLVHDLLSGGWFVEGTYD